MSWARLDDQLPYHRKIRALPPPLVKPCYALYVASLQFAQAHGTDGRILREDLRWLLPSAPPPTKAEVAALVRVRLWDGHPAGGWTVHDYLDYNPSAAQRRAKAQHAARTRWGSANLDATEHAPSMHPACSTDASSRPIPSHPIPSRPSSTNPRKDLLSGAAENGVGPTARRVLELLNTESGRSFRFVPANLKLIEARLKSGATEQQCRAVIIRQCREWRGNPDMAPYLRPATLFNALKFEQYLGQRAPRPATEGEADG